MLGLLRGDDHMLSEITMPQGQESIELGSKRSRQEEGKDWERRDREMGSQWESQSGRSLGGGQRGGVWRSPHTDFSEGW